MNISADTWLTSEIRKKTFQLDLVRGFFRGIITSGTQTFALFIAIRLFDAGNYSKSLIGSAPFIGMLFSLFLVHYASLTNLRKSTCGALSTAICGFLLIVSAGTSSISSYTICIITSFIFLHGMVPFLTSIYSDNYPTHKRGAYYSKPIVITVIVSVLSGFIGSWFLDQDLGNYKWILFSLGLAALGKGFAIYKMPSKVIEDGDHKNPLGNLKLLFEDRSFGYVLLTWFIMGFANLWVLPLRVDYITSSHYGIEGSAMFVALIITIIPDSMRAISAPILARLFDRINFIKLRMIINIIFALGIGLFFLTKTPWVIGIGAALIGIAFGGGTVAWGLWVTKYAPPGKVTAYMSVHVFLTGVRGTIGPMIGFWMVDRIGTVNIGLISFGLMIVATLMLIPEIKHGEKRNEPLRQTS